MVIWHNFDQFLLFLLSFSLYRNYLLWENVAQASSAYITLRFHVVTVMRGWKVSHEGPQKGQNWWFNSILTHFCCFYSVFSPIWTAFCEQCGSGILSQKIPCFGSQEGIKGQLPGASKGPKMMIWLRFDQFFLLLFPFLNQHLHLHLHLHQHKIQFERKCGPGIFLLHCTKIPCCDSKEGMNGQPSRASKRPKVAIWLNAD